MKSRWNFETIFDFCLHVTEKRETSREMRIFFFFFTLFVEYNSSSDVGTGSSKIKWNKKKTKFEYPNLPRTT